MGDNRPDYVKDKYDMWQLFGDAILVLLELFGNAQIAPHQLPPRAALQARNVQKVYPGNEKEGKGL